MLLELNCLELGEVLGISGDEDVDPPLANPHVLQRTGKALTAFAGLE